MLVAQPLMDRRDRDPSLQLLAMNSWCGSIAGQVTCRSRVSASSGNHSRTFASHSASASGGPPGTIPAASAATTYFRTVLRSTFKLAAISLLFRPACQWTRISMMSTTSNVLSPSGLPPRTSGFGGMLLLPYGQVQPDTHAVPTGIT